jgi:hypothetical protein
LGILPKGGRLARLTLHVRERNPAANPVVEEPEAHHMNTPHTLRSALLSAPLVLAAIAASGCNNAGEGGLSGAAIGAGAGAIIGSLYGDFGKGAAIGAIAGGIGGAVIGDQNQRNAYAQSAPPPPQTTVVYPPARTYYVYPAPTTYYYIGGSSCNVYQRGYCW